MVTFQEYLAFSAGEPRGTGCKPITQQIAQEMLTFTEFTYQIARHVAECFLMTDKHIVSGGHDGTQVVFLT